ncbi:hypothetical protein ACMC56_05495 [Campylobacterota bacterium DY0563]
MSNIYSFTDKISLKVVARNFKNGEKIQGHLKLLDNTKNELAKKDFETIVVEYKSKYSFIIKDLANELGVKLKDVAYVNGWMDSDNDRIIDYNEEVTLEVMQCCKQSVPSVTLTPGTWLYYEQRNDNYLQRASECSTYTQTAPEYYLGYGKKYCKKFVEETKPKFSEDGKKWMEKVLINLQKYMEEGVVSLHMNSLILGKENIIDKINDEFKGSEKEFLIGIECRSEDHRLFAFATHPDAYMPKIMAKLSCSDLIHIGFTPEKKEWYGKGSGATYEQAFSVAKEMGIKNISSISGKCIEESVDYVRDNINNRIENVKNKVYDEISNTANEVVDKALDKAVDEIKDLFRLKIQ